MTWLQELHRRLGGQYQQSGEQVGDRRAAMLLKHAGRREAGMAEALGEWLDRTERDNLQSYFQYVIQDNDLSLFDSLQIRTDMSADEVADAMTKVISRMALLYRRLAEMSDFEAAAELFSRLADRSESERDQVAASLQQLKDL